MSYKNIILESGKISRLILNKPEKRNAMSKEFMREIKSGLCELDSDPNTSVIIISGNGKGFCAGADLSMMAEPNSVLDSLEDKSYIMDILTTMGKITKVIISQVHGFALAGGFGIAMTADLVVLSDTCKLAMPEIKRGLVPMNIMNPLSRCMPRKHLLEMMLTGEMISPKKALEWGLANRVVPEEQLEEETLKLAESIACNSVSAIKLCKTAFYNMQDMDYYTAFHYLTDLLTINAMTQDAKEGVKAFFEKREPVWTGR